MHVQICSTIYSQSRAAYWHTQQEMRNQMRESKQHIVVIPYPAQGHINSFLHLSHKLISHGFKIIFVNTDYNHKRIVEAAAASGDRKTSLSGEISFVSFPDGLDPEDDRAEFGKATQALLNIFPSKLEELIKSFSSEGGEGLVTCVLADMVMSWTLEVAQKLGIRGALHWTMPASALLLQASWPELQENGIIDPHGLPLKNEIIQLHPGMPFIDTKEVPWYNCSRSTEDMRIIFKYLIKYLDCLKLSDLWLCNSVLELESRSFALFPKLRPIGPLVSTSSHGGQLWSEDLTCLQWLDEQKPKSVVYIAFGSFTIFDMEQFRELALGLDALGKPILWVVRSGFTANGSEMEFPDGFQGNNVKLVSWAPQLKVLSHPAVACFVSHCGWNSTMEGVANGVPFLCWPYFSDQPMNKSYICDIWKVGLGLEKNENGVVTRDEVRAKVEQLLGDDGIRERALRLKEIAAKNIAEGGNSSRNFYNFIKWLRTAKSEVLPEPK